MYKDSLKKYGKISILVMVFALLLIASNVNGVSDQQTPQDIEKDSGNSVGRPIQPIQSDILLQIPDVTRDITGTLYHVPLGKRLVIEFVSAEVPLLGNEKFNMHIQTKLDGSISNHFMTPNLIGRFGTDDIFVVSQQTKLYADPDTDVLITINRNAGGGIANIESSISGYLVDVKDKNI